MRIKKVAAVVALIIAMMLGANIYSIIVTSQSIRELKSHTLNQIKDGEFLAIKAIVDENIDKAKMQADEAKGIAEQNILSSYPDKTILKKDLNVIGDYPVYHILKSSIDDRFLNVQNDNNDMHVWTKLGKVADTSHNCAFEIGEVVTIDGEIAKQNDKPLAEIAINSIMNQENRKYFFWIYLRTPDGYYLPQTMDESEISILFDKYGARGFEYLEFLVPRYLRQNSDVLGIMDINQNGVKTDNDKIVFVQGFNVYDDLVKNHADLLEYYDNIIGFTEDKYDTMINNIIVNGIFLSLILLIGFIGMLVGINKT